MMAQTQPTSAKLMPSSDQKVIPQRAQSIVPDHTPQRDLALLSSSAAIACLWTTLILTREGSGWTYPGMGRACWTSKAAKSGLFNASDAC